MRKIKNLICLLIALVLVVSFAGFPAYADGSNGVGNPIGINAGSGMWQYPAWNYTGEGLRIYFVEANGTIVNRVSNATSGTIVSNIANFMNPSANYGTSENCQVDQTTKLGGLAPNSLVTNIDIPPVLSYGRGETMTGIKNWLIQNQFGLAKALGFTAPALSGTERTKYLESVKNAYYNSGADMGDFANIEALSNEDLGIYKRLHESGKIRLVAEPLCFTTWYPVTGNGYVTSSNDIAVRGLAGDTALQNNFPDLFKKGLPASGYFEFADMGIPQGARVTGQLSYEEMKSTYGICELYFAPFEEVPPPTYSQPPVPISNSGDEIRQTLVETHRRGKNPSNEYFINYWAADAEEMFHNPVTHWEYYEYESPYRQMAFQHYLGAWQRDVARFIHEYYVVVSQHEEDHGYMDGWADPETGAVYTWWVPVIVKVDDYGWIRPADEYDNVLYDFYGNSYVGNTFAWCPSSIDHNYTEKVIRYAESPPSISYTRFIPLDLRENGSMNSSNAAMLGCPGPGYILGTVDNGFPTRFDVGVPTLDTNEYQPWSFTLSNNQFGIPTAGQGGYELYPSQYYPKITESNSKSLCTTIKGDNRMNKQLYHSPTMRRPFDGKQNTITGVYTCSLVDGGTEYVGDLSDVGMGYTGGSYGFKNIKAGQYLFDKARSMWSVDLTTGYYYDYGVSYKGVADVTAAESSAPKITGKLGNDQFNASGTWDKEQFWCDEIWMDVNQPILYAAWDSKTVGGNLG